MFRLQSQLLYKSQNKNNYNQLFQKIQKYFAVDATKDYYSILGVSSTASDKDIKTAFYKKAKQYHPDIYKGDPDKIKEVNSAYEILRDKTKKQEYDMLRGARNQQSQYGRRQSQQQYGDPFMKRSSGRYDPNEFNNYYYYNDPRSNPNQGYYYKADQYYNKQKDHYHAKNGQNYYTQSNFDQAFKDFVNEVYQKRKNAEKFYQQQQQYYEQQQRQQGANTGYNNQYRTYDQYQQQQQQQQNMYNNYQGGNPKPDRNTRYQYNQYQSSFDNWSDKNEEAFQFYRKKMEERAREQMKKQQEYDEWRRHKEEQFVRDVEQKVDNLKQKVNDIGNKFNSAKSAFSSFFKK